MRTSFTLRASIAAAVVSAAALALSPGASGAAKHDLVFRAGQACDFRLAIDFSGGDQRNDRTFVDANGNPVRFLSTGVGSQLTFTNLATGATLALPANGAVSLTTVNNADGSSTVTSTGHNVLILFRTDVPAGPSTTLIVGREVFTVSAKGVFTLLSTSGTTTDICAALS